MSHQLEIAKTEQTIKDSQEHLKKFEALNRLMANTDFQEIIMDGFMVDRATRCIQNSISTSFDERACALLVQEAQASGFLANYFREIERQGSIAGRTIDENREFLIALQQQG